jgi:hypothetical protein
MAMARRSSAEKPLFLVAVSLTASEVVVTRMVWPSGAAPLTAFAARLPPAPPRFSTTTVWASRSLSRCATNRATTSAMPPAAKATWNVMVCVGKLCAESGCATPMVLAMSNRPSMARKADSARGIIPMFSRPRISAPE